MHTLEAQLQTVRTPTNLDNVYKDECLYSFDTPETETGLFVSLISFYAFGKDYVDGYFKKTGHAVFLHIRREKKEIPLDQVADGPEKKITRLAIGVEGGFDPESGQAKYTYEDHLQIVVLPSYEKIPYPSESLPECVVSSVTAVLAAESALTKQSKESLMGTWDGEARFVSKYANDLKQLDNGKKIPPSGWKCEECDLTNNLWLNLTDGSILCGRKFFDGSGGNNHAVKHFEEVGHPLAVKLGTITKEGKGDVYSYVEDDMVEDPNLILHLSHFGIKTNQLEKTEKSMIELEMDLNQRVGEWNLLTESASNLLPIGGPGYTGMRNLGNSCYLNSVMQVMFVIPDFVNRFVAEAPQLFAQNPPDPANDFNVQLSKLGVGLMSGKYSEVTENAMDAKGISPVMFKNLIGKGHADFSSKTQQDAQEFFLYLINVLERNSKNKANPGDALKFTIEDRMECCTSGKVKYTQRDEWCLPLQIPLHLATNIAEVKAYEQRLTEAEKNGVRLEPDSLVRPRITLNSCLEVFGQVEIVEQFYSTAIKAKTTAKKTTRLASMPDFLMLHLKKFTLKPDWTSMKLDVAVDIPDILDLTALRATGLLPNEEELPELGTAPTPPPIDPVVLQQLIEMGFPSEACKRAMFFSQNTGVGPATQWIMEHITDDNFSDQFVPPGTDNVQFQADAMGLEMLMGMGFTAAQATKALKETNNNVERAADWIFSHQGEIEAMETGGDVVLPTNRDGNAKYKLVAFISHMGTSSQVGHYVCHIQKDGQWVIFNDEKVAVSQNPPKELGYLYLYQRL